MSLAHRVALTAGTVALSAILAHLPGVASSAQAGTLQLDKRGLMPAWIWIDGAEQGKLKNRKGMTLELENGEHEVWVAIERGGTVTRCHGLVDVPAPGATVEVTDMRGCEGLTEGFGHGANTAFRGTSVDFTMTNVEGWVQVDGGQPLSLPQMPFLLNLDPGTHTIVLWNDVHQTSVLDQGTVTLAKGQHLPVTCTPGGCMGFDAQPVIIQVNQVPVFQGSAPGIQVNVPGIQVNVPDVQIDTTVSGGSFQSSSSTSGGSVTTSGSSNMSCCVNDSYYSCPDADAVYQCSGAFMQCMMSCDMMDMDCPEQCMDSHPLDPSRCSRDMSMDNTCGE